MKHLRLKMIKILNFFNDIIKKNSRGHSFLKKKSFGCRKKLKFGTSKNVGLKFKSFYSWDESDEIYLRRKRKINLSNITQVRNYLNSN